MPHRCFLGIGKDPLSFMIKFLNTSLSLGTVKNYATHGKWSLIIPEYSHFIFKGLTVKAKHAVNHKISVGVKTTKEKIQ